MAIRRTAQNAARAMKYTAMEALSDLAPTSIDIFRQARSGVEDTRNYMRSNMSKIKTHSKAALDSGTLGAAFRHYMDNSIGEIRKGNLAIQDITKGLENDFDQIMAEIKSESISRDVGSSDAENEEIRSQRMVSSADLGVDESIIKMMAATGTGTVEALRQLQGSMTQTQLSAAEYMTNKLSTVLFSQMSMQAKHFDAIEKSLGAINKNLESLVTYQSKSQNAHIHANMTFFDEMSGYLSRAEAERKAASRDAKKAKRRKSDGFLADRNMNLSQYKSIIEDNFKNSELGIAFNMMTGLDMDFMIESALNGVDPKKILGKAGLGLLMPRRVRRSIRRSDNMLNTMLKSGMSRLGSYQYDMKNHPILGVLGSIFGIDTRLSRKAQLGKFNHMDRSWNGEAQRALVNIIPKYLAEVSANTKNQADLMAKMARQMGINHRGTTASYYDMETGTYQTKAQARALLQKKVKDAKENPFANIFNAASFDPDDILDRDLWKGMSQAIQDQISTLMNTAVDSVDGMTSEMNQQLQDLLAKGLKRGDKDIDVDRMMSKLVQSVQQSRQNMFNLIEQIQSRESAFSQIAPEIANQWGTIEYDDLMKFLGRGSKSKGEREKTSINLRDANSGKYSIKGRNYALMGEDAKARAKGASDLVREFMAQVENLPNSQNPAARKAGNLIQLLIYGRNRSAWANAASGAVDRATTELFDLMMGTGRHYRGPSGGSGGSGGPGGGRLPNIDRGIQGAADAARVAGAVARGAASSAASKIGAATSSANRGSNEDETDKDERNLRGPGRRFRVTRGIINRSFQDSADGPDDVRTTADATSQMRDTVEEAFGKKGYMAKIYNSPAMQKLWKNAKESKVGKAAQAGIHQVGSYVGSLFGEDYIDEETGEVTKSFKTRMKDMASPFTDKLKAKLGVKAEDLVEEEADKIKEGMEATTEAVVGKDSPEKQKQTIFQAAASKFRKSGTKIASGAAIGTGASILSGGSMGLIGSFFLPGGPIGAALLGSAISLAWKNETFQRVLFGEDKGDGKKTGGLISDNLQKAFKKNLPTFKKGAAAGIGIKLATSLLGIHGPAAVATGALPAMFGPGGIMGAALIGAAGAFMLKNEKVQDILFGKEVDGKRSGTLLSNMYNKYGGKIKDFAAGTANNPGLMKKFKAVGVGAASGAVMSHLGILGSALSFGGPIGGAIVGSALGMAAMTPKFQKWIFGDEDPDDPTKRKNNGLLSRVSNALDLHVIEPMSNWLSETGQEFALYLKEKVESPLRIMLSPFKDLAENVKDTATGAVETIVDTIGNKVGDAAKVVIEGVGGKFVSKVLLPMAGVGGKLIKTGIFASLHLATAPLNILSGGFERFSKTGRRANRGITDYLKGASISDIVARRREAGGDDYGFIDQFSDTVGAGLAKTPFLRRLVRNTDLMRGAGGIMEGARDTTDSASTREILDAKLSQFSARKERADLKKQARERKSRDKKRRSMAKILNYTRGADIDEDTYESLVTQAKDLGYDVTNRGELDDFIFDINSFNQRKQQKEARAAGTLSDIEDNNMAELDAHQKSRHDEMMEVMRQIAQNTGTTADVGKAQLDLDSGNAFDTSDSKFGGKSPTRYSDKVDETTTKKVMDERQAATTSAFKEAIGSMRADEADKVRLEDLRGNDSGNADDDSILRPSPKKTAEAKEKKKSFLETMMGLLGSGGGLSGLIGPASIAAILGLFVGNEDFRNWVKELIFGKSDNEDGTSLTDFVTKTLPEAGVDIYETAMGKDGGAFNKRAIAFDEEGNVTESVENEDLKKHTFQLMTHPISAAKTAGKLVTHLPIIGKPIRGVTGLVSKGTTGAAKALAENKSLLAKAINWIINALKSVATGNAQFMKLAGAASKVSSSMTNLLKASDDIILKIVEKGVKATHCAQLEAAFAKATGTTAAGGATAGVVNAVLAAGGAIDGYISTAHLFKVDPNYATTKMKLISTIWGGVCGAFGAACLVAVLNDIIREYTGLDFICICADFLYDIIATKKEEEVRDFGRQYLGTQADVFNALNDTKISDQAYNDIRNRSWTTDLWNTLTGKVSADKLRSTGAAIELERQNPTTEAEKNAIIEEETKLYDVKKNAILWAKQYKQKDIDSIAQNYGVYYEDNSPDMALANKILANLDTKSVDIQDAEVKQYGKYKTTKPTASELSMLGLDSTAGTSGTTKKVWSRSTELPVYAINDQTVMQVGKYKITNIAGKAITVRTDDSVVVSGETYYKIPDKATSGYTPTVDRASAWWTKDPTGFYIRASSVTNTKPQSTRGRAAHESGTHNSRGGNRAAGTSRGRGYGGRTRGGELVGYGETLTQNDPRWANYRIGTLPSGAPSTMADGGCGPTALANAAQNLGSAGNPLNVARYASENGMISQGGATSDLFDRGAKAFGLNSNRVKGTRDIANSLRQGNPVILSGKGSGSDTPFTNAGHVVTATGLDSQGNVTIKDPQRKGQYKYKLSDVQKKMTGGWAISKAGHNKKPVGYGLIDSLLGGFSNLINWVYGKFGGSAEGTTTGDGSTAFNILNGAMNGVLSNLGFSSWTGTPMDPSESKGRIWNYLRSVVGMSEEAASGMMGCWEIESHNRADRLEGDYVKGFPKVSDAMSSNAALNDYFTNYLWPAYRRKGKSINVSAYKGSDGNYYPGIGLAQWTGPRGERLLKTSKATGMDWRDLYAQLNYAMTEFGERKNSKLIFDASSPSDGAYKALAYYEMSKEWADTHPTQLKNRQNAANAIYATYKGTMGIPQIPVRGSDSFKGDPSIISAGVYTLSRGKYVYNGKGEKVMAVSGQDAKIETNGGVDINGTKYAFITDYDGYFEPTTRRSARSEVSPLYYFALVNDLTADPSLTYSLKNYKTSKGLINSTTSALSAAIASKTKAITGKGGTSRGGRPVGYGMFDAINQGFNGLTNWVYEKFGLDPNALSSTMTDMTSSITNSFTSSSGGSPAGYDDSTIYAGSIAKGKGFVPRLTRPTAGNKYYITKSAGGYSSAIKGSPTDPQNNVLHNCVGYAYGRFNEIIGQGGCNYLAPVHAERFMDYRGGLEAGMAPRVGAVAVWSKGSKSNPDDGAGHVAIVEQVKSPTEIVTSESGWKAKRPFWTQARSKGNGNWDQSNAYKFQGFIYNPAPSCQPDATTETGESTTGYGPGDKKRLTTFNSVFQKDLDKGGRGSSVSPILDDSKWNITETHTHGPEPGLPTSGYGGGDIHAQPNAGVETRLDRIISILTRIAKNGERHSTTTTNVANVSYGTGDGGKETVKPVIIAPPKKEEPGAHDSLHNYNRTMHRKIAAKGRFI